MKKQIMALLVSVLALVVAIPCSATPVQITQSYTLLNLIQGDISLQIGDKIFSNFYATGPNGEGNFSPVSLEGIWVTGYMDGDSLIGLQFTGNFTAFTNHSLGIDFSSLDIFLGYTVTAADATITDVHLAFNGGINGNAAVAVTETIDNDLFDQPFVMSVTNPPPVLNQAIYFPFAVQTVDVTKDIALTAIWLEVMGDASANISSIDQYYSQVPEPSSLILLGSGLIAMGIWFRKKR